MSPSSHSHPISFDREASAPAPVQEGARSGYFKDDLTRELLGLEAADHLLHSGSYGHKEPGRAPVDLSLVRGGSYDQRLLPFVPKDQYYFERNLAFHHLNGQWIAKADSLRVIKEALESSMIKSQQACAPVALSLPSYARVLASKLRLADPTDGRVFPFQFQAFFTPSACRARWVRIARVVALLDGFSNLCHRIVDLDSDWKFGTPVGLRTSSPLTDEEDLQLARAYQFLGLPIEGPYTLQDLSHYSLEDAQDALLGRRASKAAPVLHFDSPVLQDGSDDDSLFFADIYPEYDELSFRPDGTRTTRAERQEPGALEDARRAQADAALARLGGVPVEPINPAPPPYQPRPSESAGSAVDRAIRPGLLIPPSGSITGASTPISTPTSISPSVATSAISSGSTSSFPHSSSQTSSAPFDGARNPAGPTRRSKRRPRLQDRYIPPPSPRRQSGSRRSPSPRYSSRRSPSPSSTRSRRAPSPRRRPRSRSPASSSPLALVPRGASSTISLPAPDSLMSRSRAEDVMLVDDATGDVVTRRILNVSFANLGIQGPTPQAPPLASERSSARPRESLRAPSGFQGELPSRADAPELQSRPYEPEPRERALPSRRGYSPPRRNYSPPRRERSPPRRGYYAAEARYHDRPRDSGWPRRQETAGHLWGASSPGGPESAAMESGSWGPPVPSATSGPTGSTSASPPKASEPSYPPPSSQPGSSDP